MDQPQTPADINDVIDSGNQLISDVSHHPAILKDNLKKKKDAGSDEEMMDISSYGDELDQIELANKLVSDIDDCVKNINKTVRSKYSHRFPELKVIDPMQYLITVQLLGNRPERIADEKIKSQLSEVLDAKMLLLVAMTASTTQGIKIEPDEMEKISKACAVAIHLANLKVKLLTFVEENMTVIAPNISVILGAPIAAKLMGIAGGLKNLAYMPSCNIRTLGSRRMLNIETDVNTPARIGHIYECDLVQQIPFDHTKDVRKKAINWCADKCALAARCDLNQSHPDGTIGRRLRDEIEAKINKELEPPPKKAPRPLPAPIDKSGKKRGGKRVRRMKERYAQTELRRAANRIAFGDVGDDAYQDDLGFDRSQLKAIQGLRGPQINQKSRIRLSKGAQKKLAKGQQQQQQQTTEQQNGDKNKGPETAKPVAVEHASITLKQDQQEFKIFNPKAKETNNASTSGESSNYFSDTTGFFAIKRDNKT